MVNTFLRKKTKNIVLSKELQRVVPAVTETGTVTWSLHIQLIYIYILYIYHTQIAPNNHITPYPTSARGINRPSINQPARSGVFSLGAAQQNLLVSLAWPMKGYILLPWYVVTITNHLHYWCTIVARHQRKGGNNRPGT